MTDGKALTIPAHHTLPRLARDPLGAFAEIGRRSAGAVVRLNLGLFRPYLVTDPGHVQHVLRDHSENYLREGMLWKPIRRLEGDGIGGEGPNWAVSRRLIQPMFAARAIDALIGQMAQAVTEAVDELDTRIGQPLDVTVEMTRIVHRAVIRAFFGDRIPTVDAEAVGHAIAAAFTSLGSRMLLPFVPDSVPLPGDRTFRRAVRTVDAILVPHIRAARERDTGGSDIVSMLVRARDEDGQPFSDQRLRDDVVSMFVAGTETTALALTWVWVLLDAHPEAADAVLAEVTGAVGQGPVEPAHLSHLRFTRMVVQEALRLYPVGWITPRTARESDVLGGVRIKSGATVLLSPYLTHRVSPLWEEPERFDPLRFDPEREREQPRPRFAYFPFGGGRHQCLGSHFFMVEAQLVIAALLCRYRLRICGPTPIRPRAAAALRPSRPVEAVLERAR
jgi:cytochrome P450